MLSRVDFCNLKMDTSIAEQTDNIVALMIAVVSCYDADEGRQDSSMVRFDRLSFLAKFIQKVV